MTSGVCGFLRGCAWRGGAPGVGSVPSRFLVRSCVAGGVGVIYMVGELR